MPDGSVGVSLEPLSKRVWGFDWRVELPWSFDDVTAVAGTFDQALDFVAEHYATIFQKSNAAARFLDDPLTNAKRRFCAEMDVVLYRHAGRVIGVWLGHPVDWSTYYVRSVALLPEYRDRRVMTEFVKRTYVPLAAAGVERIECECSPANIPMMKIMASLGFIVVATANSERWGATVRFSKFLRPEAERVFARQFCAMAVGGVTQHAPGGAPPTGEIP
jgi:RimJ/RimL family protein N-acetyltransferase